MPTQQLRLWQDKVATEVTFLGEGPPLVYLHGSWGLRHDEPYRGGFTTMHFGRPREGVHAIQIELARRLYMDERTLAKRPAEFASLRAFCKELVRELGALKLPP